jgi:hypothetical protein
MNEQKAEAPVVQRARAQIRIVNTPTLEMTCSACGAVNKTPDAKAVAAYHRGAGLEFDCFSCNKALVASKGPGRHERRKARAQKRA